MFKRFILSFSALIVFISAYFAYTSITFTKEILDELETRQAARLARFILEQDNILDEKTLIRLKRTLGGEVFVYAKDGTLLATTMEKNLLTDELKKIAPPYLEQLSSGPLVHKLNLLGQRYRLVLFEAQLTKDISAYFGLLLPASMEEKIQKNLIIGLSYTAFSGLVFMLVVSWLLSRSFTQPLEELVVAIKDVGQGLNPIGKERATGGPGVSPGLQRNDPKTLRVPATPYRDRKTGHRRPAHRQHRP